MKKSYFKRYLDGEYQQVWDEIFQLGKSINEEPLYSEVIAVVTETMNRVKHNIEYLEGGLLSLGYKFGLYPPDGLTEVYGFDSPIIHPKPDVKEKIAKIESFVGIESMPLSIKYFWQLVGDVNFTGYHPDWPIYTDPLIVYSYELIDYEYLTWKENSKKEKPIFSIVVSPDYFHKANVSGGDSYRIFLPNRSIDASLVNEHHNTTFVNYLRISINQGGFTWPENYGMPSELKRITEGIIPF